MAPTAMPMSPWPVISTTGRLRSRCLRRSSSSRPSIPGRRISLMTMPGKFSPMRCRASSALPTPTLAMSSRARACWQPSSTWGSSSTIRTLSGSFMGTGLAVGGGFGQAQLEGGAAAFRVLHGQATGGGRGQGQAEAQAFFAGFGGEEGFEQMHPRVRRDARTVVAHGEQVARPLVAAVEPELAILLLTHGVEGVGDQVDQNLLQADLVDGQAGVGLLV